ncbi:MAG: hypothetical protein AB9883_07630 [Acidaminococcaceae bacterium]
MNICDFDKAKRLIKIFNQNIEDIASLQTGDMSNISSLLWGNNTHQIDVSFDDERYSSNIENDNANNEIKTSLINLLMKRQERIANELNSLGVDIGQIAYCIDKKTRPEIKDALRELVYLKTIKVLHTENSRIIFEPSSLAIEIAHAIIDEFTLKSVSYYINSFGEIIYPNLENYQIGTMIVQHGNEKLPAAEIGIPEQ